MCYADLKAKRLKYHISQSKLAVASGYTKAAISSWERNKVIPSPYDLEKLNAILTQLIDAINAGTLNIQKKSIRPSQFASHALPKNIKSPEEYKSLLSAYSPLSYNPYRAKLSELYKCAQCPKSSASPKAIALFSGCGGMSLGFASAGFNVIGHVEIDESACQIYHHNFPHSTLLAHDICSITDKDLFSWQQQYGPIDLIIGGPPCQGFSLAGKRDPEDVRNQLYKYYVHIVSVLRPKIFVMENVRLLTSMKTSDGELFIDCILRAFSSTGYSITRHEINASDYGVPQTRERLFLVGVRSDLNKKFIFPDSIPSDTQKLTFRDATFDLPFLESGESSLDPLHWSISHPTHVIQWLKNVPEGHSAHENIDPALRPPSGFNTTYKRIRWDEPCSTISTNFSMISGCRNVHPSSTRSLTIREATRAQSFPDEFIFTEKWGDIRRAIGNAVPPILAACIAKALYQQFFDIKSF